MFTKNEESNKQALLTCTPVLNQKFQNMKYWKVVKIYNAYKDA